MKSPNVIKQLNYSESAFPIDWALIDEDNFLQLIRHKNSHLISNLGDGMSHFLKSSSDEVHKNIGEFLSNHDEFNVLDLAEKAGYAKTLSVKFFPRTDEFLFLNDDFVPHSNINISDETKNNLKDLATEFPEEDSFELKLELDAKNMYLYQESEALKTEKETIKKITKQATVAASLLVAASIFTGIFSSPSVFKNDIEGMFKKKSLIELSVNKVNDYSAKLDSSLHELNQDLNEGLVDQYLPTLKILSSDELNQAILFVNHNDHNLEIKDSEVISHDEKVDDIESIIADVYNKPTDEKIRLLSASIANESDAHGLDYKMMLSIIKAESSFDQSKVSSTGDLSVAQINYDHWNPEFKRLHYPSLNKEKLKTDTAYSVKIMAEILDILAHRYKNKDKLWYARYHSGTPRLKIEYAKKIKTELNLIEKSEVLNSQEKITSVIAELNQLKDKSEDVSHEKVNEVIVHLTYLNSLIDWKISKLSEKHQNYKKASLLADNTEIDPI
jgi:hypothetical protein